MTIISSKLIKELRSITGAGMMNCKVALKNTNGNLEESIHWLREKGVIKNANRSTSVKQGLVSVLTNSDMNKGVLLEVNSETDFVSRNKDFQNFVSNLSKIAFDSNVDKNELLNKNYLNEKFTVLDELNRLSFILGEKISIKRVCNISVDCGVVSSYIHKPTSFKNIGNIGVLISLESKGKKSDLNDLGYKICMHIAAMRPLSLDRLSLDPKIVSCEKDIIKKNIDTINKSEKIIHKIIEGRLNKFYEKVVLLDQVFVMDNNKTIMDLINEYKLKIKEDINISKFSYFILGAN